MFKRGGDRRIVVPSGELISDYLLIVVTIIIVVVIVRIVVVVDIMMGRKVDTSFVTI